MSNREPLRAVAIIGTVIVFGWLGVSTLRSVYDIAPPTRGEHRVAVLVAMLWSMVPYYVFRRVPVRPAPLGRRLIGCGVFLLGLAWLNLADRGPGTTVAYAGFVVGLYAMVFATVRMSFGRKGEVNGARSPSRARKAG